MKILVENLSTVGELKEALKDIPDNAVCNPFGAIDCVVAYDKDDNTLYIDEELYDEDNE